MSAQISVVKKPLQYVALWQFLAFFLLLCLIWVNEALDLPALLYGRPPSDPDWLQGCVLSAGVILVGFVTIAHTYMQQHRLLKGIITVCSYCHKVHLHEKVWEQLEEFIQERTPAEFSHGVCPACYEKLLKENQIESDISRLG